MAGGNGSHRQGGNSDKVNQYLYHHHLHPCLAPKSPVSEGFKLRRRLEIKRTRLQSINLLQENILRIFTESLHCDLTIIHGCSVILTNQCIVRTRSPHFYEVLEPYFIYNNKTVKCFLNVLGIFHQVESFVRLLYNNLDLSQEEQLLVELILNITRTSHNQSTKSPRADDTSNFKQRSFKKVPLAPLTHNSKKNSQENCDDLGYIEENEGNSVIDASPVSSGMADSGLETGSVSPHETTISETSGMELEEFQATEDISMDDDSNKVTVKSKDIKKYNVACGNSQNCNTISSCNDLNSVKTLVKSTLMECNNSNDFDIDATCSSVQPEQRQLNSSGSSDENAQKLKDPMDEISQYETQMLNDPFYESDYESEDNEQTNSFVPTESFEFIDPVNVSPINSDIEKESIKYDAFNKAQSEEPSTNSEARSMTTEELRHELSHSNDLPIKKSSSSTSSYYFIDASTLNDEEEVVSMEIPEDRCSGGRVPSYISNSIDYVPSRPSKPLTDEQSYKFTTRKLSNLQGGHEKVAEFERELKLTEHLKPLTESRKVKRLDSTSDDMLNVDTSVEKEALVIEIKEADSGESAQASPCPDNGTNVDSVKDEISESTSNEETTFKAIDKDETCSKEEHIDKQNVEYSDEAQRPPLIRRNTFELDSSEEKLSVLRQEYERRQGSLVFQSSIPQYSGHRVDGDSCFGPLIQPSVPSVDNVLTNTSTDVQKSNIALYSATSYTSQNEKLNNYLPEIDIDKSDMVYPVIKSASDKLVTSCNLETDDEPKNYSSSLPVTLSCSIERENRIVELARRQKRNEATPIVSGGASTSDYSKPTDSPIVRRKTESTPIVSGGSVLMSEPVVKIKPTRMSTSMTAWIVDMSNHNKTDSKPLEINDSQADKEGMSQSFSTSDCIKKNIRQSKVHEKHGSLGFFVNFNDTDTSADYQKHENKIEQREQNGGGKQYCEFYIDMSDKGDGTKTKKQKELETNDKMLSLKEEVGDKKNIFSMFIDLSCPTVSNGNQIKSSDKELLAKSFEKRAEVERRKLEHGSLEEKISGSEKDQRTREQRCLKEATKPSVFMFIESDSPVVRRRTLSSSRPSFKRHSWNIDKTQATNGNGHVGKELIFQKEHKRAHSLSVDRGDLRRLQTKTSNSSHSLSETAQTDPLNGKTTKRLQEQESNRNMDTSVEDVFEFDMRDTPPNSHIEIVNEELRVCVKHHNYKELVANEIEEHVEMEDTKIFEEEFSEVSVWDKTGTESIEGNTRKSETFDISSGSGPSSESNHDFELSEILNGDVQNLPDRSQTVPPVGNKISETRRSLNEKIKEIECELKSPDYAKSEPICREDDATVSQKDERTNNSHDAKVNPPDLSKATGSNFVRLSDLDKTPIRFHTSDTVTVKEDRVTYRMSSSIPETSWIESKLVMSRSGGPVRSLSRKLTSTMTTSLPPKQKSPLEDLAIDCEGEGIISESDLSSMQSSMGRSGAGSTEETETSSLAGKPYNRLGEDLLRMFLEEINPDITIDVAGRRIRAHKCILSSRCQYFAAILSGGWVESAGNIISLQGYSYNAVHFALCHIYSGESNIPDTISIVELATLADMLCLEGLKEVIGYTLTVKYCHLFHKPCPICAVGVLECMPLAAAYGLDEVYRKSLRWITRHFVRIWPCKAFATLPRELMEKCYHQHIVHMSTDNVLQTMMDCDKLLATLPNVRWAEPVFRLVSNLLETSVKFLSENFSGVLGNEKFQALGRELTWNISRLEDNFLAAADRLSPEQACKSYSKLHKMLVTTQIDDPIANMKWGQLFVDFLKKIQCHVEKCLIREAVRAARTTTWLKMDLELRRRIQELACLVILPHETSKRQSRHSNFLKESKVPPSRSSVSRNLDLRRVKMAISEHTDKTLKQATLTSQTKKVLNKPKTDPLERKVQESKQISSDAGSRPKSWPNKLEVKSRYLEPRNKSVTKETVSQVQPEKLVLQQRRKIMISSSDSSRTSSPAMKRAVDKKSLPKMKLPIKKDVKALSSDSLTESSVNRSNSRKDLTSKSCGITRPESPSFKQKDTEIGLSVDSLAEPKKKLIAKKKTGRMDTSMSTDSLMTEITATPKSNVSNKLSPTLARDASKSQMYERVKKMSPPMQQRSPLTIARRPPRSLESSTAASRNRAVAISSYQGSPNLRRNLLDAAKTPDIPSKSLQKSSRQTAPLSCAVVNVKKEKKEILTNQHSLESPSKKSSPKANGTHKGNKSTVNSKKMYKGTDDKVKTKCHNGESTKQPTVGSRSGTFLKDEPTILKKGNTKSSQLNI